MFEIKRSVCFTGHRAVSHTDIAARLDELLVHLIEKGYRYFRVGGALGFDTEVAQAVLRTQKDYPEIRLVLCLPYHEQSAKWSSDQRAEYEKIKSQASEVMYTSEGYTRGCFHIRNRALVDGAALCVAYQTKQRGGTAYTVGYARKKGLEVINLADSEGGCCNNCDCEVSAMPDGVTLTACDKGLCNCEWVHIENEKGADAMDKPVGNYVTIQTNILERARQGELDEIAKTMSEYLLKIMRISDLDSVLVVGIGNRNVTADSLGVRVADRVWATRHIADDADNQFGKKIRPVSVISPGVMGITGISTAEIVKSICGEIRPSLVILIDALAARKTLRLYSSIQMTDTGLTPSAGLGEGVKRQEINSDFLGIPVVSIGVPTVINAANVMLEFINLMQNLHDDNSEDEQLEEQMSENIHQYAEELFASSSPFVTAKEIDAAIHYSAYVISTAINMALFQDDWTKMSRCTYI